jgi:two-component sensor histidine kinase
MQKGNLFLFCIILCYFTSVAQELPKLPDSLQIKLDTCAEVTKPWALLDAGGFYFRLYNYAGYDKALEYYQMAEQKAKEVNEPLARANAYLEMANVYDNVGLQIDKVLEYYQTYLQAVQYTKDTAVFIRQHMNIANTFFRLGRLDECKNEITKLLALASAYGKKPNRNRALIMAAQLYKEMDDLSMATSLVNSVDTTVEIKNGMLPYLRHFVLTKAWIKHKNGNNQIAAKMCESLLQVTTNKYDSIYILENLNTYLEFSGDYKKVILYLRLIDRLRGSIANEKAAENITAKMWRTDAKLKEENASLQKKINNWLLTALIVSAILLVLAFYLVRHRVKQNRLLKQQHEEKTVLLEEVHHRVKNNLEMLQSFLFLQKRQYTGNSAVQLALGEAINRIESIAFFHKQLYSEDLISIEISDYFSKMLEPLMLEINKGRMFAIKLQTAIVKYNISTVRVLPMALLLNEWITNTVKHAFPETQTNPEITIAMTLQDDKLKIDYFDNGMGEETIDKSSTGFGSRLIKALAKQTKGTLELNKAGGFWHYILTIENA